MENWTLSQRIDLAHELTTRNVAYAIASVSDKLAHTWTVTFVNNGVPANLNGATVVAYAIRSQDNVSVVLQGSLSGNVATVTLYPAVYAYMGTVSLLMRITKGTTTISTVYAEIIVRQSYTGEVVDPGMVIPNLDQLIAMGAWVIEQINACDIATKFAEAMGQYAKEMGDYAKGQGDYAKSQGDYAKDMGDYAYQAALDVQDAIDAANAAAGNANDAAQYARDQGDAALQYAKDGVDGIIEDVQNQVDGLIDATAQQIQGLEDEVQSMIDLAYDENAVLNLQKQIWELIGQFKVTLLVGAWDANKQQTVAVPMVTSDDTKTLVQVGYAVGYKNPWRDADIEAIGQQEEAITFQCDYTPPQDIDAVVAVFKTGRQV